jgi:hypothetical protein
MLTRGAVLFLLTLVSFAVPPLLIVTTPWLVFVAARTWQRSRNLRHEEARYYWVSDVQSTAKLLKL